jgi:hypothetical protein
MSQACGTGLQLQLTTQAAAVCSMHAGPTGLAMQVMWLQRCRKCRSAGRCQVWPAHGPALLRWTMCVVSEVRCWSHLLHRMTHGSRQRTARNTPAASKPCTTTSSLNSSSAISSSSSSSSGRQRWVPNKQQAGTTQPGLRQQVCCRRAPILGQHQGPAAAAARAEQIALTPGQVAGSNGPSPCSSVHTAHVQLSYGPQLSVAPQHLRSSSTWAVLSTPRRVMQACLCQHCSGTAAQAWLHVCRAASSHSAAGTAQHAVGRRSARPLSCCTSLGLKCRVTCTGHPAGPCLPTQWRPAGSGQRWQHTPCCSDMRLPWTCLGVARQHVG